MNTFNYFSGGKAPELKPKKEHGMAGDFLRFDVRNVAHAIATSDDDNKQEAERSFEHIMALLQSADREIRQLRYIADNLRTIHATTYDNVVALDKIVKTPFD